ncbi:class I SAM-dependent methyltransferase [Methanothrix sp.]|uniref:class I SAM-dependent methyltransferase n=1 Tax=Methanothrix sp. TaxID=90426 RepID=UPI00345E43B3
MGKSDVGDKGTNVDDVMRKIKESIKIRQAVNASTKTEDTSDSETKGDALHETENRKEWEYINSNWNIQNNNYFISSHRRILGKPLIKGRELVHGEVQRYIDPSLWKQREFNSCIVRILNGISERLGRVDDRIAQSQSAISDQVNDRIAQSQSAISDQVNDRIAQSQSAISDQVNDRIAQSQSAISDQVNDRIAQSQSKVYSDIGEQVRSVILAMNKDIENRAWLAGILEEKIAKSKEKRSDEMLSSQVKGLNYFIFEDRFRGSRNDTKAKQLKFVKYFEGCKNVLDIGCGRGEFLELLKDNGISGHGIDIDEDMVRYCRSRDLNVEKLDAVSYLNQLEDKSLDGIFIDQVVEHLDPDYLIKMIDLCYKKMLFGAYIIMETVNPLSLLSLADFYMDMSHKRPVHPETLKFLMSAAGFRETVAQFYEPAVEDGRLRYIDADELAEKERSLADIINRNTDMLNNMIFGPRDYAAIGKK